MVARGSIARRFSTAPSFPTEVSGGDFGGAAVVASAGSRVQVAGRRGGADGRGALTPETQERLREFQRRNLQSEVSRLLIALLLTSDTPFRWIGTAQSPEGNADVLEVKTPDGVATRVFIDTMTHMPLMLSWTGPAGRGFGRGGQGRRGQGPPDQSGPPRLKDAQQAISRRQEARPQTGAGTYAGEALRVLPSPSRCISLNTRRSTASSSRISSPAV